MRRRITILAVLVVMPAGCLRLANLGCPDNKTAATFARGVRKVALPKSSTVQICDGLVAAAKEIYSVKAYLNRTVDHLATTCCIEGKEWRVAGIGSVAAAELKVLVAELLDVSPSPSLADSSSERARALKLVDELAINLAAWHSQKPDITSAGMALATKLAEAEDAVTNQRLLESCPALPTNQQLCDKYSGMLEDARQQLLWDVPLFEAEVKGSRRGIKRIDSGLETDCVYRNASAPPESTARLFGWCEKLQAVLNAVRHAQEGRGHCLRRMGEGVRMLDTVAVRVSRELAGAIGGRTPSLATAVTDLWGKVRAGVGVLRGKARARWLQSKLLDPRELQLSSILLRFWHVKGCPALIFNDLYSPRSCASMRKQLAHQVTAQTVELKWLRKKLAENIATAKSGIGKHNCGLKVQGVERASLSARELLRRRAVANANYVLPRVTGAAGPLY